MNTISRKNNFFFKIDLYYNFTEPLDSNNTLYYARLSWNFQRKLSKWNSILIANRR